jgi:hypothetical protein
VDFQNFPAYFSYRLQCVLHDSLLPPAMSYASQLRTLLKFRGSAVARWYLGFPRVLITSVERDVAAAVVYMSALRVRHAAELLLYSYL